jgi:hypothetical protein
MIFGIFLAIIGLIFTTFIFINVATNPVVYNGIGGLRGSFLGSHGMTMPFIISLVVMIAGLIVMFYEAYIRK